MIADTILANIIHNDKFRRIAIPYLKTEYFESEAHRKIFDSITIYVDKYNSAPSTETLKILIENRTDLNEKSFKDVKDVFKELVPDNKINEEWLINETEKYCQKQAFANALRECIKLYEAKGDAALGDAPKLMSDALAVSFDTNIGHDFLEDYEQRYDFYHKQEERIPFNINILNLITKGGLPKKSLTCFLATTGAGKSLVMCHMAADAMMQGKNVLYITMELAEERVSERIDANLLDMPLDDLLELDKNTYTKKIERLSSTTKGKLIVKEYPTGSAHAGHFRHLLNELKLKKDFIPDIIFIDYINICASSRIKGANAANSYTLVKSIAEELRGLSMEFDLPIVTATQANRSAYGTDDIDITNVSESLGLAATLDALFALITSDDLQEMNQLMIKQLKNRWGDISQNKRFVVGIDRSKMKLYNLDDDAQQAVTRSQNEKSQSKKSDKPSNRSKFDIDWNETTDGESKINKVFIFEDE